MPSPLEAIYKEGHSEFTIIESIKRNCLHCGKPFKGVKEFCKLDCAFAWFNKSHANKELRLRKIKKSIQRSKRKKRNK